MPSRAHFPTRVLLATQDAIIAIQDAIIAIKVAVTIAIQSHSITRQKDAIAVANSRSSRSAIVPAAVTRVVTIYKYLAFPGCI